MASLHGSSAKAQALRERIDASLDTLAKAVDDVRASETFREYLTVQAKFHRYSWHNAMLILSQRPNAERVAGFRTWKKLGRYVRKGETGIMIFAPCPYHREVDRNDGDTETIDGVFFKAVHVFDVSQTDGQDLPNVDVPTVDTAADDLLAALKSVATRRGIAVDFRQLDGGHFGASKGGSVEVDNTHFGLDVEVRASRYIVLWDGDSKALRESLERIATTARGIIDDVEARETRKAVA